MPRRPAAPAGRPGRLRPRRLTLASPICFIFRSTIALGSQMTVPSRHLSWKALSAAALVAAGLFGMAGPVAAADEGGILIQMNEAKIVKLARPADTIVIGNPQIADAAVQDASTVVLTAKGFGVTNLVILDDQGNPIVDQPVTVVRQTASSVRVYR